MNETVRLVSITSLCLILLAIGALLISTQYFLLSYLLWFASAVIALCIISELDEEDDE